MNNCSAVPSVCTPQHQCEYYPLVCVLFHPPLAWAGGLSPSPFLWFGSCLIYGHRCSSGLVILHLTMGTFTMLYWWELFLPGATFPWCSWALISLWWSFSLVADSRDNTMDRIWPREKFLSLFISRPVVLTFAAAKLLCRTLDLGEDFWGKNTYGNVLTFPSNSCVGTMLHKCHFHSCCCPGRLW